MTEDGGVWVEGVVVCINWVVVLVSGRGLGCVCSMQGLRCFFLVGARRLACRLVGLVFFCIICSFLKCNCYDCLRCRIFLLCMGQCC